MARFPPPYVYQYALSRGPTSSVRDILAPCPSWRACVASRAVGFAVVSGGGERAVCLVSTGDVVAAVSLAASALALAGDGLAAELTPAMTGGGLAAV